MKLLNKNTWTDHEFTCELTEKLDELTKIGKYHPGKPDEFYLDCYKHYIYAYQDDFKKEGYVAIRVPGGTVGDLEIDDNQIIKSITIDTNYVIKSYPENVNEIINELFVGQKIEI